MPTKPFAFYMACLLSFVCLTYCAAESTPSWPTPEGLFFRTASQPATAMPAGEAWGKLVVENGCVRVENEWGSTLVVGWPYGFQVVERDGLLHILDDQGEMVAVEGDDVSMGGGMVEGREYLQRIGVPPDCPGPYFGAGEVMLATPQSFSAQPTHEEVGPADALRRDAAVYAAAQGIDVEEALARLARQEAVGQLGATLEREEADTFGGLYIQHQPNYKVVVLTTQGAETLRPYIEEGGLAAWVEVQQVSVSLATLRQTQRQLLPTLAALDMAVESGIDIPRNRVVLYGRDVEQLAQALAAVPLPPYVELRETEHLSSEAAP